jgi:hypothetical protein
MSTNARCTSCRHYRGSQGFCRVAQKHAGGNYRRTCEHFAPPPVFVDHGFVIRAAPIARRLFDGEKWHTVPQPMFAGELAPKTTAH